MKHTTRPKRIGMIVPSSNTCLEPQSYRILDGRDDVTIHSARIPVTRIGTDAGADKQFDIEGMRHAAELLATADVDVVAWNGTSGSWLGPGHDRAIATGITAATGIPATTSTLAYFDAFTDFDIQSIGLITPYTQDVNEKVITQYSKEGIRVAGHRFLGLCDNESFARVAPEELIPGSLEHAADHPDALIYLCTNLYGAPSSKTLKNARKYRSSTPSPSPSGDAFNWQEYPSSTAAGADFWVKAVTRTSLHQNRGPVRTSSRSCVPLKGV